MYKSDTIDPAQIALPPPFALSLSKGLWFDKAFSPERSRRITTNGSYLIRAGSIMQLFKVAEAAGKWLLAMNSTKANNLIPIALFRLVKSHVRPLEQVVYGFAQLVAQANADRV